MRIESLSQYQHIFDTPTILTFQIDEGAVERLETLLREETIILPYIARLEIYYITPLGQAEYEANKQYALSKQLPAIIFWHVYETTLLTSGRLKAHHRLSLASPIIAEFAPRLRPILECTDPELEASLIGVEREIPPSISP